MPNYCHNSYIISHENPEMLARAKSAIETGRLCQEFVPLLDEEATDVWGTKWDVFASSAVEDDDIPNTIKGYFATAWTPPIPVYQALEKVGFVVEAKYFEPGVAFYGYYQMGSGHDESFGSPEDIPEDIMEEFGAWDWFESEE